MSEKYRRPMEDDDLAGDLEVGLDEAEAGSSATWASLFNFTSQNHFFSLVLAVFFSIASGAIAPALALFLGKVFDSFSDYGSGKLISHEFSSKVALYSLSLSGLGIASGILNGAFYGCWLALGELQSAAARNALFSNLLDKEMQWFDERTMGIETLVSRLQSQIKDLQNATSQPLGFVMQCIATVVTALALSFYHSWSMTLITLAAVPISTIFLAWISARIQPHVEYHIRTLTLATRIVAVSVSDIDAVKTLNGQTHEVVRYSKAIKRAATHFLAQAHGNAIQIGFCRLVTLGMFVQGFWYGGNLIHQGKNSTGDIVTAFMSALIAAEAVERALPQLIILEKGRAAVSDLRLTQEQVERGRRIGNMVGTLRPSSVTGSIELKNVFFSYPSTPEKMTLNGVSLSFAAGETTFVVGKSGSGKSTIANLLLGLYRAVSGQVLLDSRPIQVLDIEWLRHSVALCQQQSTLFNETFRENILFGTHGRKPVKDADVSKAIDFACLRSVVEDLPHGLDTKVGIGGTTLSGGQEQRVALARTRLRNAPILVLDEATSALDQMTKLIIFDNIRKWRRGKTTIIITHDMEQILQHDYVYILDGGCLSQQGYRHELHNIPQTLLAADSPTENAPPRMSNEFTKMWEGFDAPPMIPLKRGTESKARRRSSIISRLCIAPGAISSQLPGLSGLRSPLSPRSSSIDVGPQLRAISQEKPPELLNIIDVIEMKDLDKSYAHKNESSRPEPQGSPSSRTSFHARSASGIHRRLSTASTIVADMTRRASVSGHQKVEKALAIADILATVWPSLSAQHRTLLLLGFGSATIHSAAVPAFSWAFARLLGTLIVIDGNKGSLQTQTWSIVVLAITVIDAIAFYSMHYLLQICGQSWIDATRAEAYKRILDQPKAWFELDQHSVSRITEKLDRCAEEMRGLLGRFAGFVYMAATMMIISIVWSMVLSFKFTLVGLATMPVIYALTRAFEKVSSHWESKCHAATAEVGSVYHETFANFRTVLAFTLKPHFREKCARTTKQALHLGMKRSLFAGVFFGLSDSAFLYVIALILWYGAHLASTNPSSVDSVLSALTILLFGISNVNAAIAYIPQIGSARVLANQLLHLAQLPYHTSHEHTGHAWPQLISQISFSNVDLIYPSRSAFPALTDFTLDLRCDRTTALVGFSGSGKSSVAAVIMGLYPPSSGSITIDQVPLRNINYQSLRSLIAIVPQQPTLFPATVAENISYAMPENGSLSSLANAKRAAKLAGIDEYIMTLPQGYNTVIGPGGVGLSGGQQQRIAIARAIARRPKYLILDEATSGLDDHTAQCIRDTIRLLAREGTGVLVITHHRKMMEICEDVVVTKEGRVVETGSFVELRRRRDGNLRKLLGE